MQQQSAMDGGVFGRRLEVSVSDFVLFLHHFSMQIFKQLARTYADNHATMSNNDTDRCGASFYRTRGIINGALWYSFAGGKIMLSPQKLLSKLGVVWGGGYQKTSFPLGTSATLF